LLLDFSRHASGMTSKLEQSRKPVPRLLLDLSRHACGMTLKLEAPHGFDFDQH
jgi:hypothetical protein